jgi:Spy/CpxP family protein refolding chaperone
LGIGSAVDWQNRATVQIACFSNYVQKIAAQAPEDPQAQHPGKQRSGMAIGIDSHKPLKINDLWPAAASGCVDGRPPSTLSRISGIFPVFHYNRIVFFRSTVSITLYLFMGFKEASMKFSRLLIAVVVALGVSRGLVALADDATTQPSSDVPHVGHSKIPAPFNMLTDLTDDQKDQIKSIHKTETAAEKKLRAQEHDDIMALLTDDQKKELDAAIEKAAIEKKAESEENRAKTDEEKAQELQEKANDTGTPATTQPSSN